MIWLEAIIVATSLAYIIFIYAIRNHWVKNSSTSTKGRRKDSATVIICARNEADNIRRSLTSIFDGNELHDQTNIVVVDDHSEDATAEIVETNFPKVDLIRLSNLRIPERIKSFKKYGINHVVDQTDSAYILTMDADCSCRPGWIEAMLGAFDGEARDIVSGPVIATGKGLLGAFQTFDSAATNAAAAFGLDSGWYHSASGANLAYPRTLFLKLDPYEDNYHIASGDDIFLLEAAIAAGHTIAFNYDECALVITRAEESWRKLFYQRLRWAGKSRNYKNRGLNILWIFLICYNLLLPLSVFLGAIIHFEGLLIALIFWTLKIGVDYLLVSAVLEKAYSKRINLTYFIICGIIYPFFILALSVLMLIPLKTSWKGRKI